MIRPGPSSIEPGAAPGGVVIHLYAVPTGRLIGVDHLLPDDDIAAAATLAVATADDTDVCLVGYDGDTGARYTVDDWTRFT
jgi:hypothetical protein